MLTKLIWSIHIFNTKNNLSLGRKQRAKILMYLFARIIILGWGNFFIFLFIERQIYLNDTIRVNPMKPIKFYFEFKKKLVVYLKNMEILILGMF